MQMPNQYQVSRSPNREHWTIVGEFFGSTAARAVSKARKRDKSRDRYWRTILVGNRSASRLGAIRDFDFPPQAVAGPCLTTPICGAENTCPVQG